MKLKALVTIIILCCTLPIHAQSVGYTYKPVSTNGCNIQFNIIKQDSSYYIITTVKSTRLDFLQEPTMLLKTFDGKIIKLHGVRIGNSSESSWFITENLATPSLAKTTIAQFKISPEQLEEFQNGISKIRLSTIPVFHERTFAKDKIGRRLYRSFVQQRNQEEF